MNGQHIDTYLVGQVMGDALAKYCNDKGISLSDMFKAISQKEDVFMLGLKDSFGWAKPVLSGQLNGFIVRNNKHREMNTKKSATFYDSNDLYSDLFMEQREQM